MLFVKYTLHYKNQISKVKKKIALLVVRNNYAELDWILPILYKIKKNYKIVTFFQSKKIYENFFRENISLFDKWKKVNYLFFFPHPIFSFFFRLIKFFSISKSFDQKINETTRKFIYSEKYLSKILLKNNLYNHKIDLIFHDLGKNTAWINTFQNNDKNMKLIRYMHSTVPRGNYKKDKDKNWSWKNKIVNRKEIKFQKNLFVLASTKNDLTDYLNSYHKKNIHVVGYPRYQKSWINSFRKFKSQNNKKIILVGTKQYKDHQLIDIKKQIISIMNVTSKIKNSLTVFKPHPAQNINELKNILKKFNKNLWKITNNHIFDFNQIPKIFIGFHRTSATLDALAIKLPCIKLWSWKAHDKSDLEEQVYLKRYGAHNSILTELKMAKLVKNQSQLEKYTNYFMQNSKSRIWKQQQTSFKKLNSKNTNLDNFIKKIL